MVKVKQTESIEKQLLEAVMMGFILANGRYSMRFYMPKSVVGLFKNTRDVLLPKLMGGEVRVKV